MPTGRLKQTRTCHHLRVHMHSGPAGVSLPMIACPSIGSKLIGVCPLKNSRAHHPFGHTCVSSCCHVDGIATSGYTIPQSKTRMKERNITGILRILPLSLNLSPYSWEGRLVLARILMTIGMCASVLVSVCKPFWGVGSANSG